MITTKTSGANPTHRLYVVTGEGENMHRKEIAAAWSHRDGNGISIDCDALPLSGKIVMHAVKDRPARATAQ